MVAIADGTLFPLASEPQTEDAPDYSGCKYWYSLSVMIICDDTRKIWYYLGGWPGSAHDNQIFWHTKIAKNAKRYFSPHQYLIGDSAIENNWFVVSAFKKPTGMEILQQHQLFNDHMAKLRIISEHTIGILKGRLPWLRSICILITDKIESLEKILHYIDAKIILHNLLIELNEKEDPDWIDLEEFSDIYDAERAPYKAESDLNKAVRRDDPKDERRKQVLHYFQEFNPNFV